MNHRVCGCQVANSTIKNIAPSKLKIAYNKKIYYLQCMIWYLKMLRPHQWLKNSLILVPLFLSHQYNDIHNIILSLTSFFIFCLVASAVYISNDIIDIKQDRQHATKKYRAIASGKVPWQHGVLMIFFLLGLAAILTHINHFTNMFVSTLCFYILLTLLYSYYLKKIMMVDVITLACFYTLRLLLGTVAVQADISFWLLSFSMFLFLSLSLIKRYSELNISNKQYGRAYMASDKTMLSFFGVAAGYTSALIFLLYTEKINLVYQYYSKPYYLWPCGFVILYWVSRLWLLTARGNIKQDPILFVARDKASWLAFLLMATLFCLANG